MIKRKAYLGLGVLLVSISVSFLSVNGGRKNIEYNRDVKDILPLMEINETIISMAQLKDIEAMDYKMSIEEVEEMVLQEPKIEEVPEDKQIEDKQIEIDTVKEDIVVANNIEKEQNPQPTPNRGGSVTDKRNNKEDLSKHLNNYVLDVIKTYTIGDYPYLLNNDFQNYNGVTEDLYYGGELMLKANPNGDKSSHCTGISFEVFFKAMQKRNKDFGIDINNFNDMSNEQLHEFILTWYVALGTKSESNLAVAIERYGLGSRITNMEDLRPGDFIDLSRDNNSGHAVIFINWIREGNKIIGLRHWSSQGSTNGISYKEEYFNIKGSNGQKYGNVRMDNLNMVRVSPINEYKRY